MQAADWVSNNSIQFNSIYSKRQDIMLMMLDAECIKWVNIESICWVLVCVWCATHDRQSILKTQTQSLKRASPMSYSIWYFLAIISIMVFLIFPIFLIFLIFTIITWKLYFWFCNLYNCKMSRRDYTVEESAANIWWVMCCFSFLIS